MLEVKLICVARRREERGEGRGERGEEERRVHVTEILLFLCCSDSEVLRYLLQLVQVWKVKYTFLIYQYNISTTLVTNLPRGGGGILWNCNTCNQVFNEFPSQNGQTENRSLLDA